MQIFDGNQYVRQMLEATQSGRLLPDLYDEVQRCSEPVIYVWDGVNSRKMRQEIYPAYKTHRTPAGESIYENIKAFKGILDLSQAVQVEVPGWEADDVVATLATRFRDEGHRIQIRSSDSDFLQIAGERIACDRTEYKVPPRWVRLYKTMVGDAKDTVPGIKGFGQKSWDALTDKHRQMFEGFLNGSHGVPDIPLSKAVSNWLSDPENQKTVKTYWVVKGFIPVPIELIDEHCRVGNPRPDLVEPIFQEFML